MSPAQCRIADWVRERRERIGWTIDDLSMVSGCSVGVVRAVESGVGTTRVANVAAIVESLGGVLEVTDG